MIAKTWGEFLTELWNSDILSWNTLFFFGILALAGMFLNALSR